MLDSIKNKFGNKVKIDKIEEDFIVVYFECDIDKELLECELNILHKKDIEIRYNPYPVIFESNLNKIFSEEEIKFLLELRKKQYWDGVFISDLKDEKVYKIIKDKLKKNYEHFKGIMIISDINIEE